MFPINLNVESNELEYPLTIDGFDTLESPKNTQYDDIFNDFDHDYKTTNSPPPLPEIATTTIIISNDADNTSIDSTDDNNNKKNEKIVDNIKDLHSTPLDHGEPATTTLSTASEVLLPIEERVVLFFEELLRFKQQHPKIDPPKHSPSFETSSTFEEMKGLFLRSAMLFAEASGFNSCLLASNEEVIDTSTATDFDSYPPEVPMLFYNDHLESVFRNEFFSQPDVHNYNTEMSPKFEMFFKMLSSMFYICDNLSQHFYHTSFAFQNDYILLNNMIRLSYQLLTLFRNLLAIYDPLGKVSLPIHNLYRQIVFHFRCHKSIKNENVLFDHQIDAFDFYKGFINDYIVNQTLLYQEEQQQQQQKRDQIPPEHQLNDIECKDDTNIECKDDTDKSHSKPLTPENSSDYDHFNAIGIIVGTPLDDLLSYKINMDIFLTDNLPPPKVIDMKKQLQLSKLHQSQIQPPRYEFKLSPSCEDRMNSPEDLMRFFQNSKLPYLPVLRMMHYTESIMFFLAWAISNASSHQLPPAFIQKTNITPYLQTFLSSNVGQKLHDKLIWCLANLIGNYSDFATLLFANVDLYNLIVRYIRRITPYKLSVLSPTAFISHPNSFNSLYSASFILTNITQLWHDNYYYYIHDDESDEDDSNNEDFHHNDDEDDENDEAFIGGSIPTTPQYMLPLDTDIAQLSMNSNSYDEYGILMNIPSSSEEKENVLPLFFYNDVKKAKALKSHQFRPLNLSVVIQTLLMETFNPHQHELNDFDFDDINDCQTLIANISTYELPSNPQRGESFATSYDDLLQRTFKLPVKYQQNFFRFYDLVINHPKILCVLIETIYTSEKKTITPQITQLLKLLRTLIKKFNPILPYCNLFQHVYQITLYQFFAINHYNIKTHVTDGSSSPTQYLKSPNFLCILQQPISSISPSTFIKQAVDDELAHKADLRMDQPIVIKLISNLPYSQILGHNTLLPLFEQLISSSSPHTAWFLHTDEKFTGIANNPLLAHPRAVFDPIIGNVRYVEPNQYPEFDLNNFPSKFYPDDTEMKLAIYGSLNISAKDPEFFSAPENVHIGGNLKLYEHFTSVLSPFLRILHAKSFPIRFFHHASLSMPHLWWFLQYLLQSQFSNYYTLYETILATFATFSQKMCTFVNEYYSSETISTTLDWYKTRITSHVPSSILYNIIICSTFGANNMLPFQNLIITTKGNKAVFLDVLKDMDTRSFSLPQSDENSEDNLLSYQEKYNTQHFTKEFLINYLPRYLNKNFNVQDRFHEEISESQYDQNNSEYRDILFALDEALDLEIAEIDNAVTQLIDTMFLQTMLTTHYRVYYDKTKYPSLNIKNMRAKSHTLTPSTVPKQIDVEKYIYLNNNIFAPSSAQLIVSLSLQYSFSTMLKNLTNLRKYVLNDHLDSSQTDNPSQIKKYHNKDYYHYNHVGDGEPQYFVKFHRLQYMCTYLDMLKNTLLNPSSLFLQSNTAQNFPQYLHSKQYYDDISRDWSQKSSGITPNCTAILEISSFSRALFSSRHQAKNQVLIYYIGIHKDVSTLYKKYPRHTYRIEQSLYFLEHAINHLMNQSALATDQLDQMSAVSDSLKLVICPPSHTASFHTPKCSFLSLADPAVTALYSDIASSESLVRHAQPISHAIHNRGLINYIHYTQLNRTQPSKNDQFSVYPLLSFSKRYIDTQDPLYLTHKILPYTLSSYLNDHSDDILSAFNLANDITRDEILISPKSLESSEFTNDDDIIPPYNSSTLIHFLHRSVRLLRPSYALFLEILLMMIHSVCSISQDQFLSHHDHHPRHEANNLHFHDQSYNEQNVVKDKHYFSLYNQNTVRNSLKIPSLPSKFSSMSLLDQYLVHSHNLSQLNTLQRYFYSVEHGIFKPSFLHYDTNSHLLLNRVYCDTDLDTNRLFNNRTNNIITNMYKTPIVSSSPRDRDYFNYYVLFLDSISPLYYDQYKMCSGTIYHMDQQKHLAEFAKMSVQQQQLVLRQIRKGDGDVDSVESGAEKVSHLQDNLYQTIDVTVAPNRYISCALANIISGETSLKDISDDVSKKFTTKTPKDSKKKAQRQQQQQATLNKIITTFLPITTISNEWTAIMTEHYIDIFIDLLLNPETNILLNTIDLSVDHKPFAFYPQQYYSQYVNKYQEEKTTPFVSIDRHPSKTYPVVNDITVSLDMATGEYSDPNNIYNNPLHPPVFFEIAEARQNVEISTCLDSVEHPQPDMVHDDDEIIAIRDMSKARQHLYNYHLKKQHKCTQTSSFDGNDTNSRQQYPKKRELSVYNPNYYHFDFFNALPPHELKHLFDAYHSHHSILQLGGIGDKVVERQIDSMVSTVLMAHPDLLTRNHQDLRKQQFTNYITTIPETTQYQTSTTFGFAKMLMNEFINVDFDCTPRENYHPIPCPQATINLEELQQTINDFCPEIPEYFRERNGERVIKTFDVYDENLIEPLHGSELELAKIRDLFRLNQSADTFNDVYKH